MSETSTDGVLNLLTKQKHLKENNESTSTFQVRIPAVHYRDLPRFMQFYSVIL